MCQDGRSYISQLFIFDRLGEINVSKQSVPAASASQRIEKLQDPLEGRPGQHDEQDRQGEVDDAAPECRDHRQEEPRQELSRQNPLPTLVAVLSDGNLVSPDDQEKKSCDDKESSTSRTNPHEELRQRHHGNQLYVGRQKWCLCGLGNTVGSFFQFLAKI